jgi:hypothetical protein
MVRPLSARAPRLLITFSAWKLHESQRRAVSCQFFPGRKLIDFACLMTLSHYHRSNRSSCPADIIYTLRAIYILKMHFQKHTQQSGSDAFVLMPGTETRVHLRSCARLMGQPQSNTCCPDPNRKERPSLACPAHWWARPRKSAT